MLKKVISLILSVTLMLTAMIFTVSAQEELSDMTLTFDLTCDGSHKVTAKPGDKIKVDFSIVRTDSDGEYLFNLFQNDIIFDKSFFEYVEGSAKLCDGIDGDIGFYRRTTGVPLVKASCFSVNSAKNRYTKNVAFCSFELKVKENVTGTGLVQSDEYQFYDSALKPVKLTTPILEVVVEGEPTVAVSGVTLSTDKVQLTYAGATEKINVAITPENATNKGVTYESSDTDVATVTADGTVRAAGEGNAKITVTTLDGGFSASCDIEVKYPVNVSSVKVTPESIELTVGEEADLSVSVLPSNADNKEVYYSTSDSGVATVNNGVIKAKKAGTATISVKSKQNSSIYDTCAVTVKNGNVTPPPAGGGTEVKSYKIYFKTPDGEQLKTETKNSGTKLVIAAYTFIKTGFTFEGLYTDKLLTAKAVDFTINKDTTLYVKFVEKEEINTQRPATIPEVLTDKHIAYIKGREEGKVQPQASITRAEVATIFFRLLKDEVRDANYTKENTFADVNEGDWYNTAVSTLAKMKIINGRSETEFAPNAFITRAEYATIAARLATANGEEKVDFTDINGHWANEYILKAASLGWIVGNDGKFRPGDNITRAEAMTLTNRVLCRQPESVSVILTEQMTTFADNADVTAWYYLAIQEATNSHEYQMKPDGKHEKWTKLTETPDFSKLEK